MVIRITNALPFPLINPISQIGWGAEADFPGVLRAREVGNSIVVANNAAARIAGSVGEPYSWFLWLPEGDAGYSRVPFFTFFAAQDRIRFGLQPAQWDTALAQGNANGHHTVYFGSFYENATRDPTFDWRSAVAEVARRANAIPRDVTLSVDASANIPLTDFPAGACFKLLQDLFRGPVLREAIPDNGSSITSNSPSRERGWTFTWTFFETFCIPGTVTPQVLPGHTYDQMNVYHHDNAQTAYDELEERHDAIVSWLSEHDVSYNELRHSFDMFTVVS